MNNLDLVNEWIKKAEADIESATVLLNANLIYWQATGFLCQQATEKYLKAYLISKNIEPPKIHDINSLVVLCEAFGEFKPIEKYISNYLTDFAVIMRYPGTDDDPTFEEVKVAFEYCIYFKTMIAELLMK